MATSIPILQRRPEEGHALAFQGQPRLWLARGEETSDQYAFGWFRVPPGDGPPPHLHSREEEGFYLLRGEIIFTAGNETVTVGPGSFVNASPGTAHTFVNSGSEMAEMLVMVGPAGFDRFQFEVGEVITSLQTPVEPLGPEELARMMAAAPKYGIETQPAPERFEIAPEIRVARPGEIPPLAIGGETYRVLGGGEHTHGRYALVEIEVPSGGGSPPHRHLRATEAFYILVGPVEFQIEDEPPFRAEAGAFVQVPAGSGQRFRAVGAADARMVALLAPAGPEQFFLEAAGADLPGLVAAAERHGLELLAE